MTERQTTIIWLRNDLRIADNPALHAAATSGPVLPVYIREIGTGRSRQNGAALDWWLHHSLRDLAISFDKLGTPLILATGDPYVVLGDLANGTGAQRIFWNRRYTPEGMTHDAELKRQFIEDGFEAESFAGFLLHEPTKVKTGNGNFYRVFSPFWRALESGFQTDTPPRDPVTAPEKLSAPSGRIDSENLEDWNLLPEKPDWAGGIRAEWTPGEAGAAKRLEAIFDVIEDYAEARDIPAMAGTSRLSPHLAFGEISPAQIFAALKARPKLDATRGAATFRKEVIWREFAWHLLVNAPHIRESNFDKRFDAFPWMEDDSALKAWQRGQTGYPIVDAGMRELWQTGYMHNRVRMITASFLTKHLLIDWREGEKWFWDTLVDADPANNASNWQWVAGSGADAAPYFRIFNPVLQGEKFDAEGDYVRQYVPELEALPKKYIHKPWEAPPEVLKKAGVSLGTSYPKPVIDHKHARDRALAAFDEIKSSG